MEDPVVVIVEFLDGGRGRVVLDSSAGAGAAGGATVVVVVIEGDAVSTRAAGFMTVYIGKCLFLVTVIESPGIRIEKAQ